jgi:hypothetical protein
MGQQLQCRITAWVTISRAGPGHSPRVGFEPPTAGRQARAWWCVDAGKAADGLSREGDNAVGGLSCCIAPHATNAARHRRRDYLPPIGDASCPALVRHGAADDAHPFVLN